MDLAATLPMLLGVAWLLPLASFVLIVFFGQHMGRHGKYAAWVATGAIVGSFVLSAIALGGWLSHYPLSSSHHLHEEAAEHDQRQVDHGTSRAASPVQFAARSEAAPLSLAAAATDGAASDHPGAPPVHYSGDWYSLVEVRSLRITIGWYIDALTVAMFVMVSLIASCIHFYAYGYMHDELHEVTDHEVTLSDGQPLRRRGRFHRFFQYLSLFCFSMLGLVIAGNIAMVFVFWELVGICSYFLIGFYIERKSASTAANKAFIVNRVGDFGMIVGLMALFGALGTFAFGDTTAAEGTRLGIFSQVRPEASDYALTVPDGMVAWAAADQIAHGLEPSETHIDQWRSEGYGSMLLVIAGLGIFCGCVGKSAQFPLHVWLPDAMEGPTPVSALVHSATMVAAGVYLVGRFYPVFTPEVLLVIAYIGCITLFLAATIAIVHTDIKRVLAYSTVSQLGYMMLALGVGGWIAGMFHLITHAFFKSLLFLCSGSVIHGVHTNDITKMGGLRHKMPWTAYTMLVGCLAIIGTGIPFVGGFSGYYSKDSIIAQALSFTNENPAHRILFYVAAGGASLTAFYMFRLWYLTFAGPPRDQHKYDHAHEAPKVMYYPLVVLAVFAFGIGFPLWGLTTLLEQGRPIGATLQMQVGSVWEALRYPHEHLSHLDPVHIPASLVAFGTALAGFLLATVFYGWRWLDPREVRDQFSGVYRFLWHKWYFDELYHALFVAPVLFISRRVADFDRRVIDRFVDGCAWVVRQAAVVDDWIDRLFVDGLVNLTARWTHATGVALRSVQTGKLRQYVMLIVVGTVAFFILVTFFWSYAGASRLGG
jgi:proton-translocating NADH-quinone oxidoreductase chain L